MTNREKEMLEIIRKNPSISQNELANQLNISRSSVSVHISNLMKKGFIKGRKYVLQEENYVTVIGGANIDLLGFSNDDIIPKDSNPGALQISSGGVGRNIAENLARLSVNVSLITALGDDSFSDMIRQECSQLEIDITHSYFTKTEQTSTYMAILDNHGELLLALSDMAAMDYFPMDHIRQNKKHLQNSRLVVMDANLPAEIIYTVAKKIKKDIFFDAVSAQKSIRAKEALPFIHTIKMNLIEAEALSGIEHTDNHFLEKAAAFFFQSGVKQIFITMGSKGVLHATPEKQNLIQGKSMAPVNVTGAGDAFMAGIIYGHYHNKDAAYTLSFANKLSQMALMSPLAVNPDITVEQVEIEMNKI